MTIVRPSQGRAKGQYGGELYRHVGCLRGLNSASRTLGLCAQQQHFKGQQHPWKSFITSRAETPRALPVSEVVSATSQDLKAPTAVKVRLCFQHQVPYGQVLKVVGAGPQLGDWQPQHARSLQWSEGHVWTADLVLEVGSYEFKCVTATGDQILAWEPGSNRIVQVPGGVKGIRVDGSWSRTSENRTTVTEPIAAASSAARQKRAAAARLLVKALAEVNAAAAAGGPSVAAQAGPRQAAAAGAGALAVSEPGSKASAAAALEEEALRELKALLSPEPLVVASNGNGRKGSISAEAKEGQEFADASAALNGLLGIVANDSDKSTSSHEPSLNRTSGAAEVAASAASKASRASNWRDLLASESEGGKQQSEEPVPVKEVVTRSVNAKSAAVSITGVEDAKWVVPLNGSSLGCAEQRPEVQGKVQAASESIGKSIREAAGARGEPLPSRSAATISGIDVTEGPLSVIEEPSASPSASQKPAVPAAGQVQPAAKESPGVPEVAAPTAATTPVPAAVPSEAVAASAAEAPKPQAVPDSAAATVAEAAAVVVAATAAPAAAEAVTGPASEPDPGVVASSAGVKDLPSTTPKEQEPSAPAPTRSGFRFASLRRALGGLGGTGEKSKEKEKEQEQGEERDLKASTGGRKFSWRVFAAEEGADSRPTGIQASAEEQAKQEARGAKDQQGAGSPEPQGAGSPEPQAAEEESASDRFARLLEAKQAQQKATATAGSAPEDPTVPKAKGKEGANKASALAAALAVAAAVDAAPVGQPKLQETSAKKAAEKPLVDATAAAVTPPAATPAVSQVFAEAVVDKLAPRTPAGRDTRTSPAPVSSPSDSSVSGGGDSSLSKASSSTNGKAAVSPVADMGNASSLEVEVGQQVEAEGPNDTSLDRLLEAWDVAWSQGGAGKAAGGATSSSSQSQSSSMPTAAAPWANGTANGGPAATAASPDDSRTGRASTAGKAANGGGANGLPMDSASSSGGDESLYSLAERLTATGPSAPIASASSEDTSAGITMRSGAMAAMGVDRQGSYDARSSYLSQSMSENATGSIAGSVGGAAGSETSSSLLRQIRASSAAAYAAAAAMSGAGSASGTGAGAEANGGGPKAIGGGANGFFALPATPAPPGILGSTDSEDGEMVPPLPATPPPPSYLNGPPSAAGAVPPLPATPVPQSVLNGGMGAVGSAAEDLLRRVADADAVLAMLRGNLPLTPVARGGRGGSAGPLSMVQDEEDEDEENGNGRGAGGRGRTNKRGAAALRAASKNGTMVPDPQQKQVDLVAANRAALEEAAHAWEKARAALQTLQQSAQVLGLSPSAISDSAARILQQLPKIDPASINLGFGQQQPQQPQLPDAVGDNVPGAGASGQPQSSTPLPGLPAGVTQMASTLASGLGSVGSTLSEQFKRVADAAGSMPGAAIVEPKVSDAVNGSSGGGLMSGLISSLVGSGMAALPPGCMRLVAGAHMIPHVDKVDKGGEDAYFISRVGLGGVGVADGVSGWADEGIDPAEYPRTLMRFASDAFESARGTMSAQDIIRYAQYRTYLKGSSTVCMALMKPGRLLEVANVGDSGVRILRNGKVIFGTEAQQHAFNMPFQLSHPNNVEDPDSADDADVHLVEVQEGDVVMLATDGLFDNVFDEEIEQIVSHQLRELAAAGRGKVPVTATVGAAGAGGGPEAAAAAGGGGAAAAAGANGSSSSSSGNNRSGGSRGLLSQSLSAAAAAAGSAVAAGGGRTGNGGSQYRPEDASKLARALAERAHLHARNPTQRTPWSVTSSQQPNFMWAKFFAKGGGKMDDCTVLVAFVCGSD